MTTGKEPSEPPVTADHTPERPTAYAALRCEHFFAWVSPAGTSNSARICQLCHEPDPQWLNDLADVEARLAAVEVERDGLRLFLVKYAEHVGICEGTEFLTDGHRRESATGNYAGRVEFTGEEWTTLKEITR